MAQGAALRIIALPPGGDFLAACARHLLEAEPDPLKRASTRLILPNLLLAADLRAAMAARAGGPLILPRIQTMPAAIAPWLERQPHLPDSRRLYALYQALRAHRWVEEGALWDVCAELISLFDELTLHGVGLPENLEEFQARLEAAYALKAEEPLRFEARLVHTLWRADAEGTPSRAAARLLAARAWAASLDTPLYGVAEGRLGAFERQVYEVCAEQVPVTVFVPDRRLAEDALGGLFRAAWPVDGEGESLLERAAQVRPEARLSERFSLLAAQSLEQEARAVALQVRRWLGEGRRRIVLVAADRVASRRARALLERDGVLVEDETGWKLSTTRVAALIHAWLGVLGSDGYHRDVLDLLKSPFVAPALDPALKAEGLEALAALYARHNLVAGLDELAERARENPAACALVDVLLSGRNSLPRYPAPPAGWLQRLRASLGALGSLPLLEADGAGKALLEWLETRCAELGAETAPIGFGEWRIWLDRELDAAMFRPRNVDSPVIMTHLAATRLRRFDGALIIGADVDNLAAETPRPIFAHEAVRAELGLPSQAEARARLQDDLACLISMSERVMVSWQHLRAGEVILPSPAMDLLSLVHEQAFGDDLRHPVPVWAEPLPPRQPQPRPAPSLRPEQVPVRISASGLASLMACPYQYFARYVLGLGAEDEVSEALEKSDYGQMVHTILQRFHQRYPRLGDRPQAELLAALEEESQALFGPAIGRNFLEQAWAVRWLARLPAYLDWQRAREKEGWYFARAEVWITQEYRLPDGGVLSLEGRLDRVDQGPEGRLAVLDYKSQTLARLRDKVADPDDVQLAVYTLLRGAQVAQAAYVALDEPRVQAVVQDQPEDGARQQEARLINTFAALRQGAPLPAHGVACDWCEMRGLCRKDYQASIPGQHP